MSLSNLALIPALLLWSPPPETEGIATDASQETEASGTSDTNLSREPAPPKQEEQAQEVSPLVPRSQIEFLEAHPVDLERVQFRPGKGLTISSKSKKFSLTMGLRAQLLYQLDHANDPEADPAVEHSFQIRRARLNFSGNAFGEHNKFKVELSLSPRDVGLKDARPSTRSCATTTCSSTTCAT